MSEASQWAAGYVAIGTMVGTVVTGVILALFKYGGDYRVKVMTAQAKLNDKENKELKLELEQKNTAIESLTARVVQLEKSLEANRQLGHDERNKWYEKQLNEQKESAVRDLECQKRVSAVEGKYEVLLHQFDKLYERLYPTIPKVEVANDKNSPVPVTRQEDK